jgi:hypothetical protein
MAVEELYTAFAAYPLRDYIPGCEHCVDITLEVPLHANPLRLLSADDLNLYAFKAMTTWGELEDFKHFLPRLLELAASDHQFDHDYVAYKLDYARWQSWPQEERHAIVRYLLALWRVVLSAYPSPLRHLPAGDWLEWLAALGLDLTIYLATWRADTRLPATRHLVALIGDMVHGRDFARPLGMSSTTGERETVRVLAWLNDDATKARLEAAFFATEDRALATELSDAVAQLDWMPALLSAHKA